MTDQASANPKGSVPIAKVGIPEANARVFEAALAVHTAPGVQIAQTAAASIGFGVGALTGIGFLGAALLGHSLTRDLSFDLIFGIGTLSLGAWGCVLNAKAFSAMRRAASVTDQ